MKNIVIGVSSSLSCYKVIDLIRKLKRDFEIDVILTKNTLRLVDKKEFEKALGKAVADDLFREGFGYKDYLKLSKDIKHISLADKADIFVVCPATANVIGKVANGISDDLLSTSVMATNAAVVFCPAMNAKMWENPIVQENVAKLKKLGYHFVDPEYGELACGYKGVGRLADIDKIAESIKDILAKKSQLKGKKVIVTAGATMEEIDPVRVITNRSSGKMGIAIAEEAARRGAEVTLIRGHTDIEPRGKINDIRVESVDDIYNAIKKIIKNNDIMIHAAAVGDFKADRSDKKIKSDKKISLILKPTMKIVNDIKKLNKRIFLIGFKAEHDVSEKELINNAYKKLKEADCDLVVANDVGRTYVFGSDKNEAYIIDKNKRVKHLRSADKRIIAGEIIDLI